MTTGGQIAKRQRDEPGETTFIVKTVIGRRWMK